MGATGRLSSAESAKGAGEDVKAELHIQPTARQSQAPHFVDHVLATLETMFGSDAIQQGGIVVHTTLDLNIQQIAQQAVSNGVQDLAFTHLNNSPMLPPDPQTAATLPRAGS